MAIPFKTDMDFSYGAVTQISPLIRRIIANNPGPFTFTGTGTFIIGRGDVAVIDPGPMRTDHIDAIIKSLAPNERVTHILITHNHSDHSPAALPLKQHTSAQICGFASETLHQDSDRPKMEEANDTSYKPERILSDGDEVIGPGWTIDCVHTPGHMRNHMCYALREEKTLFTGDHVMGWATSVVAPPEGNMHDYMASLERLLSRDDQLYLPTHGPAIENPHDFVRAYIAHRRAREQQITTQLQAGHDKISAIVDVLYADVDPRLHPAAALSVLAHLEDLQQQGRVICKTGAGLSGTYSLA